MLNFASNAKPYQPSKNQQSYQEDGYPCQTPITKTLLIKAINKVVCLLESYPFNTSRQLIYLIGMKMGIRQKNLEDELAEKKDYKIVLYQHFFSYFIEYRKEPDNLEKLNRLVDSIIRDCQAYGIRAFNRQLCQLDPITHQDRNLSAPPSPVSQPLPETSSKDQHRVCGSADVKSYYRLSSLV